MLRILFLRGMFISVQLIVAWKTWSQGIYTVYDIPQLNNSMLAEANPWMSHDGLRIYFTHQTSAFSTEGTIKMSERSSLSDEFGSPIDIPLGVTLSKTSTCWLTSDELTIYLFSFGTTYYANRISMYDPFGTPMPITYTGFTEGNVLASRHGSLTQDGSYIFASVSYSTPNGSLISKNTVFHQTGIGTYAFDYFFPEAYISSGQLSKNDLSFYFSFYDGLYTKIGKITRESLTEEFDYLNLIMLYDLDEEAESVSRPSLSESENSIVYMIGNDGDFEGYDLRLAQIIIDSTFDLNADGAIDQLDIESFIADFGCVGNSCVADFNSDNIVNALDLYLIIANMQ